MICVNGSSIRNQDRGSDALPVSCPLLPFFLPSPVFLLPGLRVCRCPFPPVLGPLVLGRLEPPKDLAVFPVRASGGNIQVCILVNHNSWIYFMRHTYVHMHVSTVFEADAMVCASSDAHFRARCPLCNLCLLSRLRPGCGQMKRRWSRGSTRKEGGG